MRSGRRAPPTSPGRGFVLMTVGQGSRPEPGYPISSVGNALELLKMLKSAPGIRVAEAARALGVSPSTAHRLLAMLSFHGFVTQDPTTRAYVAGPALLELGLAVVKGTSVREQARPVIEALHARIEETVNIAILDGPEILVIDAVRPDRFVRVGPRVGHRSPAHWNATGKALLAELDDREIHRLFPNEQLPTATPKTLRTRRALIKELKRVRASGWATNLGEFEDEMGAVGAAIHDPQGRPVAAVAVTALLSRIEPRLDEVADMVIQTAREIQARLA